MRRGGCDDKAWVILWSQNRHDVAVTGAKRIKVVFPWYTILSCSFGRVAFSRNAEANNNLAHCPFFTHRSGIFCALINKLNHELAACWDNKVHLCPIILSISASAPVAVSKWTSGLNHRVTYLGIEIIRMLPVSQMQIDKRIFTFWVQQCCILLKLYRDGGKIMKCVQIEWRAINNVILRLWYLYVLLYVCVLRRTTREQDSFQLNAASDLNRQCPSRI